MYGASLSVAERFRSKYEAEVASYLSEHQIPYVYEQERLMYDIPGVYTPDFSLPGGVKVEAKGYFDAVDRRKMLAVKRANPDADIRMLFQNPYKRLSKGPGSLTYAAWCAKNGFPWAEGPEIPADWVKPVNRDTGR